MGCRHEYARSPYLAFVIAVLTANGIAATPANICTIFNRRQRTRRRKSR